MSAAVQYGRRASHGGVRSSAGSPSAVQVKVPAGALILSRAEWTALRARADTSARPSSGAQEAASRAAIREKSEKSIAEWDNSIAAMRQAKLEAKRLREEAAEAKRQEIDREEDAFQEQKRQAQLARAKALQLQQTDIVKTLNSVVFQAEVSQARHAQLGTRERREAELREQDLKIAAVGLEQARVAEQEAQRRRQATLIASAAFGDEVLSQAAERAAGRRRERQASLDERKRIEADVEKFLTEEQSKKQAAHAKQVQVLAEIGDFRRQREALQQLEEQQQAAEAERQAKHAAAIDARTLALKAAEEAKAREKAQHRDDIAKALWVESTDKEAGMNERIAKAQAERDAKLAALEAAKLEKQKKTQAEIQAHRSSEAARQNAEKLAAKLREEEALQAALADAEAYKQAELKKQQAARSTSKSVQETLETQMQAQHLLSLKERHELEERRKAVEDHMRQEQKEFEEFAAQQTASGASRGLNTVPLQRALFKLRPEAPMSPTAATKTMNGIAVGKNRLGFNWE